MSSDAESDTNEYSKQRANPVLDERLIFNQLKEIENQAAALNRNLSKALDYSILASLDLQEAEGENKGEFDYEKTVKDLSDDLVYQSIFSSELNKLKEKQSIDNNAIQELDKKLDAQIKSYDNSSEYLKYGKSQKYKEFKAQLWEITNPGEPMPSLFGEDDEDEVIVASSTVGFKCPLTTMYLVEPMTSKKCNHNYSKASISEFLRRETKPCPVTGCRSSVSMSDLYENNLLNNRVQRYLRIKRQKDLKKYTVLRQ